MEIGTIFGFAILFGIIALLWIGNRAADGMIEKNDSSFVEKSMDGW